MKKLDWFNNVENRTHPWEGMRLTWLTTALTVPDVRAATDFYTNAMGMVAIAELEGDDAELLLRAFATAVRTLLLIRKAGILIYRVRKRQAPQPHSFSTCTLMTP
ncbi:hypothetical protein HMPREF0864_01331 [Enterobacteriaceae bacterium 9_2_54FAA]|nr:hypothetical protein HMPREF0864_01331 [Enterobacteriaceae bacterium 9_2_54FAA]